MKKLRKQSSIRGRCGQYSSRPRRLPVGAAVDVQHTEARTTTQTEPEVHEQPKPVMDTKPQQSTVHAGGGYVVLVAIPLTGEHP